MTQLKERIREVINDSKLTRWSQHFLVSQFPDESIQDLNDEIKNLTVRIATDPEIKRLFKGEQK